tara:strand:+ start:1910 stop:2053 length:144 start_codon:yes stop_codon:yes gene_type:complete
MAGNLLSIVLKSEKIENVASPIALFFIFLISPVVFPFYLGANTIQDK